MAKGIFTAILVFLWAAIAIPNGWWAWRRSVRKEERVPSSFPLVGGIFAVLAVRAYPSDNPWKWGVLLLALILDYGSLPYLFLFVRALIKEYRGK